MEPSTVVSATGAVQKHGSFRKAAKALGVSHAAIWNIARGRHADVSIATENKVRKALGLEPLRPMVEVPACPDCGGVHHGRCNGKEVEVRAVRKRREPADLWGYTTKEMSKMIRCRVELTVDPSTSLLPKTAHISPT